eukprot:jgi/Galph1/643/GphlegSOOS_G5298.1
MWRGIYYEKYFPADLIFRWLSYSFQQKNHLFERRELSFTLENDVYLRYLSFESAEELRTALLQKLPVKIDIGAVYNYPPSGHSQITLFTPIEREFVIDIDLTDYETVALAHSEDEVQLCDDNWYLIATAVELLDETLKKDFGFHDILWVYSGRRGVHGWVCDERARKLSDECREAIVEYLSVRVPSVFKELSETQSAEYAKTGIQDDLLMSWNKLNPFRKRCYNRLHNIFLQYVVKNPVFLTSHFRKYLCLLPKLLIEDVLEVLPSEFSETEAENSWNRIERIVEKDNKFGFIICLVFHYLYPRLDVNVSRHINHLLKAPFCLHPKTQRVCVPFLANHVWSFQPSCDAPKVTEAIDLSQTPKFQEARKIFFEFIMNMQKEQKLQRINDKEVQSLERYDIL